MKSAKSISMGTGAVLLAGLILTLLAPKAAHAIVATAVSVVNTTANPASVLDADRATRIPYQSSARVTTCGSGITPDLCYLYFTAAPSGYRLVVENISVGFNLESGSALPVVTLFNNNGGNWTFTSPQSAVPIINSASNQNVHAYFDPSDGQPYLFVIAPNFSNGQTQFATLSGYLEDCAVVACPAIQR